MNCSRGDPARGTGAGPSPAPVASLPGVGVDYPITNEDLLERFGDHSVGLSDGETTLAETLSPLAGTTYGSGEDVCREPMNTVGDDAVGRKAYTGREPTNQ